MNLRIRILVYVYIVQQIILIVIFTCLLLADAFLLQFREQDIAVWPGGVGRYGVVVQDLMPALPRPDNLGLVIEVLVVCVIRSTIRRIGKRFRVQVRRKYLEV